MKEIKTILKSLREYKTTSILCVLCMALEAICSVVIPFFTAELVNEIKVATTLDFVWDSGIKLVICAVFSLIFGSAASFLGAKASTGLTKNVRNDMFKNIQKFSFANIDKFSSSSLITRLTNDVSYIQMSYGMVIRTAVRSPMLLVFSSFMAFYMGGFLAMCFVVVVPILVIGLLLIAKKAMPAFHAVFKKYDKLNESIEENVHAMRVVKGFSREEYESHKFEEDAESIRKEFTKAEQIAALNGPLMNICMYFNMVFILWVGAKLAITSGGVDLDIGQISSMLSYGMQVLSSLMMISEIYVILTISSESFKRVYEVLKEEPTIHNPENPIMNVENGEIEFNNVSFKYAKEAKKFALQDINLHIKSGMTVGILGGTGSSKTTLVQLLPRLYDTSEGEVKVAGHDVREYDLKVLRDAVAMVLQKNELFSGTIRENLQWGNPNATDEEIIEACKLAQAYEFVKSFPDGLDSHIEQGGTNVSGGQKQRLCIARALLKKPKILILDDSTSAVDTKTDALIRKGFKEYIPDTTKIIIAQRVASVEDADMIIILDNGKIVGCGNHEELIKNNDIYKETYEQQTKGGRE